MIHRSDRPFSARGHILAGRTGLRFKTWPDRRILELALAEDPAGFVGVPIRAEGEIIAGRFAIRAMEHLRVEGDSAATAGEFPATPHRSLHS
jgi:hypothetical protein